MYEYCKASESTVMECLKRYYKAIWAKFESYHLRQPTRQDFLKQLGINPANGFLGMFASLDCIHYEWQNFLWRGKLTLVIEMGTYQLTWKL